ncbi:unnamed protein product [Cyclocybe aegerita]|uniref:Uncharacterized protein n=1 Tax=Cyclocybe aegerita TaxID=1973307 RepID=A0A8S0W6X6_CYCAE|nr:unnamed protein product [Cyclocybe aegerita]
MNRFQDHESLLYLHKLAYASVQGVLDESVAYGIVNEMLIEHKQVLGRDFFIIFPQLRLPWNPDRPKDRRGNIPDVGLGRLTGSGVRHLQGGIEQKVATELMRNLPNPDSIVHDKAVQLSINRAIIQAEDQVKAAVKNGAIPCNTAIDWIIASGPYFIITSFGPFTEAQLSTRSHRPNASGDALLAEIAQELKDTADSTPITKTLHLIGTEEAAVAVHNYLVSGAQLYNSTDRNYP